MADQNIPQPFTDPLLQRFFDSPIDRQNKEKGKTILKAFYTQQTSNGTSLNYYQARKVRQEELLLWAKGSQNMREFLDYMNVSDADKAWVNIDTTPQRLGTAILGTVIEAMAKNKSYPCVTAIDDGSMDEKSNRMFEALFRMHEVETIKEVQQQAGIQLEPTNAYVPNDELSAKVYFKLEDRLPKEIRFEEMLELVQDNIKFEEILNRKTLYDLTVLNTGATRIEKLGPKEYTVRKCISNNMIWNFFMNDNGELEITMIGEFYNLKVKDYRAKFGKSADMPNGLTEKEIYDLAKMSTNKNIGTFNYTWSDTYSINTYVGNRPYDDCSILVMDCSINCGEDVYYVSKTDNFGKENITVKKGIPYAPQKKRDGTVIEYSKPDDVEIIKKQKKQWMRGVYAPFGDKMLYWGDDDFIINQYTDSANTLCPYSIQIPNNDGNYVPSLFERIMEPLREYCIVKLKRKQLIANLEPDGYSIDIETARNIDLGNGDTIPWEEIIRIKRQTGIQVWSSKGLDPLQQERQPISASPHSEAVNKIIELTNVLDSIRAEVRMLIGSSVYLEGGDVGDRTAAQLAENQVAQASNVYGYVLNSNNQLWEETFYKLSLLNWNDVVKEEPESKEDLLNTRFKVSVKIKSTEYEKALIEKDIDRYSQVPDAMGNPSLTLKDAMFIREIEDGKLALWYLTKMYEENRRKARQESDRNIQLNAKAQQKSLEAKGEMDDAMQTKELAAKKDVLEFESTKAKELAMVNGMWMGISKGVITPDIAMPVLQQLMPNIKIPLIMENKQMTNAAIASQEPPAEQGQDMGAEQPQEGMEQQPQSQPQMVQ